MASELEMSIAGRLRAVLAPLPDGAQIENSPELREVLVGLEFFIPKVLCERHLEWKYESLDGILPVAARKIADGEAEFVGECILISDQTVTPIHLRMQVATEADEISWLECRLGERVDGAMKRIPYSSHWSIGPLLLATEQVDAIDWYYGVTFGEKEKRG